MVARGQVMRAIALLRNLHNLRHLFQLLHPPQHLLSLLLQLQIRRRLPHHLLFQIPNLLLRRVLLRSHRLQHHHRSSFFE